MMLKETIARVRKRAEAGGVSALLQDLSKELRSDTVPGALRDAAEAVAALIDGQQGGGSGTQHAPVVINVSVAVAVGAPGKSQDDKAEAAGAPPSDAVVVATAVATTPGGANPPPHERASEPKSGAGRNGGE